MINVVVVIVIMVVIVVVINIVVMINIVVVINVIVMIHHVVSRLHVLCYSIIMRLVVGAAIIVAPALPAFALGARSIVISDDDGVIPVRMLYDRSLRLPSSNHVSPG